MKGKAEIKKLGVGSVFKVTIYVTIVPFVLMCLFYLATGIIGVAVSGDASILLGVFVVCLGVFIIIPVTGLIYMLIALVYNLFASKFGGLEITLNNKENNKEFTLD